MPNPPAALRILLMQRSGKGSGHMIRRATRRVLHMPSLSKAGVLIALGTMMWNGRVMVCLGSHVVLGCLPPLKVGLHEMSHSIDLKHICPSQI